VHNVQAVTSSFGSRRVYNGIQSSAHTGLDFKAPKGTPIYAASRGRVALAKNLFFTGNTVILDHGYGVLTLYAHMSKLKVKKGQMVEGGHLLGLSGMTGRVTGPHLHWMAIIHKQKVNPIGLTQGFMK
jgi:murein DD-endopeptidase MepM/ murein hydrolase activator NlpD